MAARRWWTSTTQEVPSVAAAPTALIRARPFQAAPRCSGTRRSGIAIAEPDGTLVETNALFQQFFGAGGDLGGRALADLAAPSDRADTHRTFVRASAGDEPLRFACARQRPGRKAWP